MADTILLEVVTPEKSVVSEAASIVMAPGTIGEFGVLPGHTPFLTTLNVGVVRYVDADGKEHYVFVSGGFAEALPGKVTVLAESAEMRSGIDLERAKEAMQRAEERLAEPDRDDIDFVRARAALQRAIHRVRLIES